MEVGSYYGRVSRSNHHLLPKNELFFLLSWPNTAKTTKAVRDVRPELSPRQAVRRWRGFQTTTMHWKKSSRWNKDICSRGQRSSRRAARRNCVTMKPSERCGWSQSGHVGGQIWSCPSISVSGVTWPAGRNVKKRLHIPKEANSNFKKEFRPLPVSGTPALRPVCHCCPVHSQRDSPSHLSCSVYWPSPWTRADSSSSSTLSLPRKWVVPVADEEQGRRPCGADKVDRLS